MSESATLLFPAFERFVEQHRLLANAKGMMAARLPRILGQGQTRAEGLTMPPAVIERQQELLALSLPDGIEPDSAVQREIDDAKRATETHAAYMRHTENRRRFALQALAQLDGISTGNKDNNFYAGRFVLGSDKSGQNWAWSITPHYSIISKIPADVDYIVSAYSAAERIVAKWTLPVDLFLKRLNLAWSMAKCFSADDDVLIADVARLFKIAAQDDRFWKAPARRTFEDVPDALFIVNLINARSNREPSVLGETFELVPATLNQAHGPQARAFFVPANQEGTSVRPMIYMRRKGA